MKKNVILFATHIMNEEVLRRFRLIQTAIDEETDIHILYHKHKGEVLLSIDNAQYYFYNAASGATSSTGASSDVSSAASTGAFDFFFFNNWSNWSNVEF